MNVIEEKKNNNEIKDKKCECKNDNLMGDDLPFQGIVVKLAEVCSGVIRVYMSNKI